MYVLWLVVQTLKVVRVGVVNTVGLPVEFLSISGSTILPAVLPEESSSSSHCLAVGIYIYIFVRVSCWVESPSRQHVLVCQNNRVSLIVLEIGACPWDGSLVGLVIGWQFPPSLLPPPMSALL